MTHNPIIALVVLMLIIYLFMYLNDIDVQQFITNKGFKLYFREKPWIVYTIATIIIYALLCILNKLNDNNQKYDHMTKNKPDDNKPDDNKPDDNKPDDNKPDMTR